MDWNIKSFRFIKMKNLDLKQFDILSKTYEHTEHINSILNGERPFPLHLEKI